MSTPSSSRVRFVCGRDELLVMMWNNPTERARMVYLDVVAQPRREQNVKSGFPERVACFLRMETYVVGCDE